MSVPRLPKDFASTLRTVACADALLANDGGISAHAWEAAAYGITKRGYGLGSKTRGSLARNLSGKVVVSPGRLEEWKADRPAVAQLAACPLWHQLRQPQQLSKEELVTLEPAVKITVLVNNIFVHNERAKVTKELSERLAACGTLDAVSALWSLLLEAEADGAHQVAWQCARHLPATLALAARNQSVRRVALPIFARMRQLTLDGLRLDGQTLQLSRYELLRVSDSAINLPPLRLIGLNRKPQPLIAGIPMPESATIGRKLMVPGASVAWLSRNLAPEGPAGRATGQQAGRKWLTRDGKPGISPCDPRVTPGLHPAAITRLKEALGDWA